jgi:hypothetical protein
MFPYRKISPRTHALTNFFKASLSQPMVTSRIARISKMPKLCVLDAFGIRQFNNPDYTGTQVRKMNLESRCYATYYISMEYI